MDTVFIHSPTLLYGLDHDVSSVHHYRYVFLSSLVGSMLQTSWMLTPLFCFLTRSDLNFVFGLYYCPGLIHRSVAKWCHHFDVCSVFVLLFICLLACLFVYVWPDTRKTRYSEVTQSCVCLFLLMSWVSSFIRCRFWTWGRKAFTFIWTSSDYVGFWLMAMHYTVSIQGVFKLNLL